MDQTSTLYTSPQGSQPHRPPARRACPKVLTGSSRQGRKPANWISDSDYRSACKRLWESQERDLYRA